MLIFYIWKIASVHRDKAFTVGATAQRSSIPITLLRDHAINASVVLPTSYRPNKSYFTPVNIDQLPSTLLLTMEAKFPLYRVFSP